ncbi:MAG TPA: hypothetical protein PLN21_16510 [Gemmatales bacterium]|nr:hypothetical protein [Gemmatales bacterium]
MTHLTEALHSLSEIHAHLARGEVYQGVKARPVMLSGLIGTLAAVVQPRLIADGDVHGFVWYWLLTAVVCALAGASGAILSYFLEEDELARRRTRIVVGQLLPSLAVGAFLTLALLPVMDHCVGMLPGVWAMLYALGLFSSRPYLPRATGWVGSYFVVTGTLLVSLLPLAAIPSPWSIALVFAPGRAVRFGTGAPSQRPTGERPWLSRRRSLIIRITKKQAVLLMMV